MVTRGTREEGGHGGIARSQGEVDFTSTIHSSCNAVALIPFLPPSITCGTSFLEQVWPRQPRPRLLVSQTETHLRSRFADSRRACRLCNSVAVYRWHGTDDCRRAAQQQLVCVRTQNIWKWNGGRLSKCSIATMYIRMAWIAQSLSCWVQGTRLNTHRDLFDLFGLYNPFLDARQLQRDQVSRAELAMHVWTWAWLDRNGCSSGRSRARGRNR